MKHAPVTQKDLARAAQRIVDARANLEAIRAQRQQPQAEQAALLEKSAAAERERAELERRRAEVLPQLGQDASLDDELFTLAATAEKAQRRAIDYADAAALLTPAIATADASEREAVLRVAKAEYNQVQLRHLKLAQETEAWLAGLADDPRLRAFIDSATEYEQQHRQLFGGAAPPEWQPLPRQVGRIPAIIYNALVQRWPWCRSEIRAGGPEFANLSSWVAGPEFGQE